MLAGPALPSSNPPIWPVRHPTSVTIPNLRSPWAPHPPPDRPPAPHAWHPPSGQRDRTIARVLVGIRGTVVRSDCAHKGPGRWKSRHNTDSQETKDQKKPLVTRQRPGFLLPPPALNFPAPRCSRQLRGRGGWDTAPPAALDWVFGPGFCGVGLPTPVGKGLGRVSVKPSLLF